MFVSNLTLFLRLFVVILALFVADFVKAERCPLFFGEFECPKGFNCILGVCKDAKGDAPPGDCARIECGPDLRCLEGKCLPIDGLPCDRNVLVAENTAVSVMSDCGWRGKCVNGRCAIDRCFEKLCNENEVCRDGACTKLLGAFCWSNFDCGSQMRCQGNQCIVPPSTDPSVLAFAAHTQPRCDPGEVYRDHKCQRQEGCASLVCDVGESCLDGVCVPLALDCRTEACPRGFVCSNGFCATDPCVARGCPADHMCLLGECRHLQGVMCQEHCPEPFVCLNGVCVRNECRRKVCQIGERCENGLCVRIDGNICTLAVRDCGEEFECQSPVNGGNGPKTCKDKMLALNATTLASLKYT